MSQAEAEERRAAEEAAAAQQQASSTEESDSAQSEVEQPEAVLKVCAVLRAWRIVTAISAAVRHAWLNPPDKVPGLWPSLFPLPLSETVESL